MSPGNQGCRLPAPRSPPEAFPVELAAALPQATWRGLAEAGLSLVAPPPGGCFCPVFSLGTSRPCGGVPGAAGVVVPAALQGAGRARWLSDGGPGGESCPPTPGTMAPFFSPQDKPHLPWEPGPVDPYFDKFRPETSFPAARCRLPSGGGGPQDISMTLHTSLQPPTPTPPRRHTPGTERGHLDGSAFHAARRASHCRAHAGRAVSITRLRGACSGCPLTCYLFTAG